MANDRYNISATQGSTLLLNINIKDSNDNYVNLEGYTARGYVRSKFSDSGILLDLRPRVDSSYVSGLVLLSGSATGLSAMPVGEFVYDIELSGSADYIYKPIKGYFLLSPECTY